MRTIKLTLQIDDVIVECSSTEQQFSDIKRNTQLDPLLMLSNTLWEEIHAQDELKNNPIRR